MCGIIGVSGSKAAAQEAYVGLFTLQHRGQDAAGICTLESGRSGFSLKKGKGLVSQVFDEGSLRELKGASCVGHVRYPTAGSNLCGEEQPFVSANGKIALVFNGNILNCVERRKALQEKGFAFESASDAEVLLNELVNAWTESGGAGEQRLWKALEAVMKNLNGGYSVICLTELGLLGFRDPNAIRPMVLGKKVTLEGVSHAFASENNALDVLGYKVLRDVGAGEAILVRSDESIASKDVLPRQKKHCMFEWVYFARPDSILERVGTYEVRQRLGIELARQWREKVNAHIDVVTPVPDSARSAALAFSQELGVPFQEGLVKSRYVQRTFIMPDQKTREWSVKMKLNPLIPVLKGKRVAVIDDSVVRGTTSRRIIETIKEAGALEVHFLSTCPPITNPCFYGVDMSTREELIAARTESVEEVRKFIGADSLTYQSIDGLKKAIGLSERICTGCLTGAYPTQVSQTLLEAFEKTRKSERKAFEESKAKIQ